MSNNSNLTPEKLLQMAGMLSRGGLSEEVQTQKLTEMAMRNMTREQSDKLKEVLGDTVALNKLLESEQAQRLVKKMSEKK
ncbi:MAG: hypothetical protein FWF05_08515 [Oscillospiraceae bacterium]|nr:hypothetical protein [Oscillospiraceae bacterium]